MTTPESKLRALVAECDALRKDRYNTTNWDPRAMQILFYCAEAMRESLEALLAERQEPPATPMRAAIGLEERLTESIWAISDGEHPAKDTLRELIRSILASAAAAPSSGKGESK